MTEIILDWLNNEVKLSKPITNLQKDLGNGYLLAEILNKTGNNINLKEFNKNALTEKDRTKNYETLNKYLEEIHLHLDEDTINSVISGQKGAMERLVYRMKTQISRKKIGLNDIMSRTQQFQNEYPHLFLNQTMYKTTTPKNVPFKTKFDFKSKTTSNLNKNILEPISLGSKMNNKFKDSFSFQKQQSKKNQTQMDKIQEEVHKKKDVNQGYKIEQTTTTYSIPKAKERLNQILPKIEYENKVLFNPYTQQDAELKLEKTGQYCFYETLDNNLNELGMDVKTIDPKLKKYGIGINGSFIPTKIIFSKVNHIVNAEKIRRKEEKESHKIPTEFEKQLRQSILTKHRINKTDLKTPEEFDPSRLKLSVNVSKKCKFYKQELYEHNRIQKKRMNETLARLNALHKTTYNIIEPIDQYKRHLLFQNNSYEEFDEGKYFSKLHLLSSTENEKLAKEKQQRHKENTPLISSVMSLILDLAEESYYYQGELNCELINLPEWHEWLAKFIQGKSPKKVIKKDKAYLDFQDDLSSIHSEHEGDEGESPLIQFVDYESKEYADFYDYIVYRGNYNFNIVNPKIYGGSLHVYEVLGEDIVNLIASGKMIASGKKPAALLRMKNSDFEMFKEEEENVKLPAKDYKPNQLFGEMIEINIDNSNLSNFVKEPNSITSTLSNNNKPTFTYSHIPIKVCFMGHLFTGRRTQAQLIIDKYPLIKMYSIKDILTDCLEKYDKMNTPIESHPKFKSLKKNQIEQMEKEIQSLKDELAPILPLFESHAKNREEAIPDENLCDLLLYFIQKDFPIKSDSIILEEINKRNQSKMEIEKNLELIHEEQQKKPKAKVKEEAAFKADLEKLNKESYSGFIVIDFPETYSQFTIFEMKTTNFTQPIDKNENIRDKVVYEMTASISDKPSFCSDEIRKKKEKKTNEVCGFFNKYIWLSTNEEETLRRVRNRKLDPNTGIIYHMEDNPPPENDKKLNERLIPIEAPSEELVQKKLVNFDETFSEILSFVSLFNKLQKIEKQDKTEISNDISEILSFIIKDFEDIENKDLIFEMKQNPLHTNTLEEDDSSANYLSRLNEYKKKIQPITSENIINKWYKFQRKYVDLIKESIGSFNNIKESILKQMEVIQTCFIEFLNQKSDKENLLQIFINKYDTFSKDYAYLRGNKLVKEDVQKDINELTGYFWEIIREKKQKAIDEREYIINSGFTEKQIKNFWKDLSNIFLIETEKLFTSLNLIREFYYSFESSHIDEPCPYVYEFSSEKLFENLDELNIIEQDNQIFPKIEKIYTNCFKLLFEYDKKIKEIETSVKANSVMNTSGVSTISITKKNRRQSNLKEQSSIFSEAKDIINYESEIKSAVTNEKSNYKLRVSYLKQYGINFIKEMYSVSQKTFDTLDDWIILSVKTQNEVMNKLVDDFKNQITKHASNLSYNIELDKFDIFEPQIFYFESFEFIKNKKLPPKEKDFDISELTKCYFDLKTNEIQNNYVTNFAFLEVLLKKHILALKTKGVSNAIKKLPYIYWMYFIKKIFIITNKDKKILRIDHLFNYLSVLHCDILTPQYEQDLLKQVDGKLLFHCYLSKNDFFNTKFWFEVEGDQHTQEIKNFLFEIYKNYNNEINFLEMISVWKFETIKLKNKDKFNYEEDGYYDILFKDN